MSVLPKLLVYSDAMDILGAILSLWGCWCRISGRVSLLGGSAKTVILSS